MKIVKDLFEKYTKKTRFLSKIIKADLILKVNKIGSLE